MNIISKEDFLDDHEEELLPEAREEEIY